MKQNIKKHLVASCKVAQWAANRIDAQIRRQHTSSPFVLGLPPTRRARRAKCRSRTSSRSTWTSMWVSPRSIPKATTRSCGTISSTHVDIRPENVNILDGNADDLAKECADYEARIVEAGGIDPFMGGVGETDTSPSTSRSRRSTPARASRP